jgi:hypothetical protein
MLNSGRVFRKNGAIGALLDEYEKAVEELKTVIKDMSPLALAKIRDKKTKDPDCVSVQTILSHVVGAGFHYVEAIRQHLGEQTERYPRTILETVSDYSRALDDMFAYNCQLFEDYPEIQLEAFSPEDKITVPWGQMYDVEQLYEHAIVHVLRHRRQIERFLSA